MEALTAYTSESTSTAASSSTSTALSTAQSTLAARRDQAGLALLHLLHALSPSSQKSVALPTPLKLEPPPPPAPALGPTIDERFAAMQAAHAQSLAALRLEFTQREQATDVRLSSLVDAKVTALASLVDAKLAERDQSSRALLDSKVAELSTSLELNPKRSPASVYAGSPRDRELVLGSLPPAPDSFVSSEKFRVWRERLYQSEFPQLQVQIEQRLFPRVVALEAHVGKGDEWLKVLSERMAGLEARTMGVEQRVGVCEAWGRERVSASPYRVASRAELMRIRSRWPRSRRASIRNWACWRATSTSSSSTCPRACPTRPRTRRSSTLSTSKSPLRSSSFLPRMLHLPCVLSLSPFSLPNTA